MTFNLAFFDSGLSWTARGAHVVLWPSWVEPSWDGLDLKYTAVLTLYIRMDTHIAYCYTTTANTVTVFVSPQ